MKMQSLESRFMTQFWDKIFQNWPQCPGAAAPPSSYGPGLLPSFSSFSVRTMASFWKLCPKTRGINFDFLYYIFIFFKKFFLLRFSKFQFFCKALSIMELTQSYRCMEIKFKVKFWDKNFQKWPQYVPQCLSILNSREFSTVALLSTTTHSQMAAFELSSAR